MKTSSAGSESKTPAVALRRRAEGIAPGKAFRIPENMESLSIEVAPQILQELRVHQIELEMQNEELRRAQAELDASRARYFDLYNLAPVGYCTLSEKGLILEANLTAATLLGVARGALIKQSISRLILKEDQDIYYRHRKQFFESGEPQACELRMVKMDGTAFWVHLAASAAQDPSTSSGQDVDDAPVCRVVLSDITERKFRENERELTTHLIALLNAPNDFRESLSALTVSLRGWSGCEAVGIRLRDGDDYPYYETCGFPPAFVQAENHLCAYGPGGEILRDGVGNPILECMCGNILCGRFDPARPFFTAHGSFWSGNTTALLAGATKADRQARTRNRCNGEGYESVALIPLRAGDQVFGLLQFNDHRPDRFTTDLIAHFERMVDSLSIALSRRQAEEALRESEERLRGIVFSIVDWVWEVDENGVYTYSSQKGFDLFGESLGDIIGKTPLDFMPPDEAKRVAAIYSEIMANKAPIKDIENWNIRRDGKRICLLTNGMPILDKEGNLKGYRGVDKDITERKRAEEELQHTLESLRKAVSATVQVMISAVETRDPYTAGHQTRVTGLARAIATEMGLSQDKIDSIHMAGSIHDIGKLSIPAEILSKPTKLSELEFSLIKEHACHGYEILQKVESSWPLAEIVYQHHERMDGSGYPRNLKGEDILMESRIIAVADVVESMASHRPYRAGLGINAALEEIEKNKGILYDNIAAEACLRLFRKKSFKLSDWSLK